MVTGSMSASGRAKLARGGYASLSHPARARPWRAVCAVALLASSAQADGAAAPADAAVRIELRARVEVRSAEVTLGDVAILSGREAATVRRLATLALGEAPRAGDTVRLEREGLARWIRGRTGVSPAQIAWSGSRATEVRAATQTLSGQALARQVLEAVRLELSQGGLRAEVRASPAPRDVTLPVGVLELRVRSVARGPVLPRRLTAWADAYVDGRFARTIAVDVEATVFGLAYVATKPQKPGEALVRDELTVQDVEWTGRGAPPLPLGAAGGLRLRRLVAAGQPVTRDDVEAAPLVTRGGWASLRASRGLVQLESRVEVLEDGRAGQMVRVKLPGASGDVLAQVTGPGAVEVEP